MTEEITGLGSYSQVARALSLHFAQVHPWDRRQIETWHKRRTRNAAGQLPPEPVDRLPGVAGRRMPHLMFDIAQWKEWVSAGIPRPGRSGGNGQARGGASATLYETPDERNTRYSGS